MPTHLISILPHKVVVDLVSMCDIMLYKVINNVLISSPLQNFPERWWRCTYVCVGDPPAVFCLFQQLLLHRMLLETTHHH